MFVVDPWLFSCCFRGHFACLLGMSVARDSSTTFPYNLYGVDDPLGLPPDRSHSQRQDTDKNSHCQAARRFGWISSDKQTNNGRNEAPSFPNLVLLFLESLWCCSLVVLYTHATVLTYARYSLSLPIDFMLVHLETFQISVAPVCPVIVITVVSDNVMIVRKR